MKGMGEGEWDTWDQVSIKKGKKGQREEHSGGGGWTDGEVGRRGSCRAAVQRVLDLRSCTGRGRRLCQANRTTEGEAVQSLGKPDRGRPARREKHCDGEVAEKQGRR